MLTGATYFKGTLYLVISEIMDSKKQFCNYIIHLISYFCVLHNVAFVEPSLSNLYFCAFYEICLLAMQTWRMPILHSSHFCIIKWHEYKCKKVYLIMFTSLCNIH